MAIQNRDLGTSQQRETVYSAYGAIATGGTQLICLVPFPAQVATGAVNFYGVSNTPALNIDVTRYLPAGVTTITGVITAQAQPGATIATGFTVSSGASLVSLQTGDQLVGRITGANANVTGAVLTLVLQALQDVKTHFGV